MKIQDKFDALVFMFIYWILISIYRLPITLLAKSMYSTALLGMVIYAVLVGSSNRFGR